MRGHQSYEIFLKLFLVFPVLCALTYECLQKPIFRLLEIKRKVKKLNKTREHKFKLINLMKSSQLTTKRQRAVLPLHKRINGVTPNPGFRTWVPAIVVAPKRGPGLLLFLVWSVSCPFLASSARHSFADWPQVLFPLGASLLTLCGYPGLLEKGKNKQWTYWLNFLTDPV